MFEIRMEETEKRGRIAARKVGGGREDGRPGKRGMVNERREGVITQSLCGPFRVVIV